MKARCDNPNDKSYPDYGGRGISYHKEWAAFDAFYSAVGPRPSLKHSLDRINNDGNYEPGNVRWADAQTQSRNRRTSRNLTYQGVTRSIGEWAELLNIDQKVLDNRLYTLRWPIERAFTQPTRKKIALANIVCPCCGHIFKP